MRKRELQSDIHENLSPRHEMRGSSDRSFGFLAAAAFSVVALLPFVRGGEVRWWALAAAAALAGLALIRPALLAPLNRLWLRFGLLAGRVTNPLIMALVFFLLITPMALIMRLRGKDPLRLRPDHDAATYWIERVPPGPAPASMTRQF
jgi:hypothetical protein